MTIAFFFAPAVLAFLFIFIARRFSAAAANTIHTSKDTILQQMNEPRPLPLGQKEFVEWSDRIISGALIPCDDKDSLVGALAAMLMQLGPTESHKPDAYFIHSLRKAAANEVAHANFQMLKKKKEAEKEKELEAPGRAISSTNRGKILNPIS